ncbi:MAG: hypothetical protein AAF938_24400 [Myxococcota bacterium]
MRYLGTERRIHKVFVTRNTEYHVRKDRCVAVKDRRTGSWVDGHLAAGGRVSGGLRFHESGGVTPNDGLPSVGESLFFCTEGRDLVTSPVVSVQRPARDIVAEYAV